MKLFNVRGSYTGFFLEQWAFSLPFVDNLSLNCIAYIL